MLYGYDEDGLVTRAGSLSLTRDAATGQVTDITLGDVSDRITWNSYGEPEAYQVQHGGAALWTWEVDRDVLGRIVSRIETGSDGVTHRVRYAYDDAFGLSDVVDPCLGVCTAGMWSGYAWAIAFNYFVEFGG